MVDYGFDRPVVRRSLYRSIGLFLSIPEAIANVKSTEPPIAAASLVPNLPQIHLFDFCRLTHFHLPYSTLIANRCVDLMIYVELLMLRVLFILQVFHGGTAIGWTKKENRRAWAVLNEGCYLLRTNAADWSAEDLWHAYIQLTEAAFRIHKTDLKIRPVWHQKKDRVSAHILPDLHSVNTYK